MAQFNENDCGCKKSQDKCDVNLCDCEKAQQQTILYNYVQDVKNQSYIGLPGLTLGNVWLSQINLDIKEVKDVIGPLPTGVTPAGLIKIKEDDRTEVFLYLVDPCIIDQYAFCQYVNLVNSTVFSHGPLGGGFLRIGSVSANFAPLLPKAPKVKQIKTYDGSDLLLIVEYITTRINDLCLSDNIKCFVNSKIVGAFEKFQSCNRGKCNKRVEDDCKCKFDFGTDTDNCGCNKNKNEFFSLCNGEQFPECGAIYLSNEKRLLQFLIYAKFLLRSSFIRSCDCELTFKEVCEYVFGRFCILNVCKSNC